MAKKRTRKVATVSVNSDAAAEHYAIAEILDSKRNENSQLEYLIKWKTDSEQSWQLVDDLFSKKRSSKALSVSSLVVSIKSAHFDSSYLFSGVMQYLAF